MPIRERLQQRRFRTLADEAVVSLLVAADQFERAAAPVWERHGITADQYNVLRILRGVYPAGHPRNEVARRMIHRAPDVTRMLDRLVRQGLVRRERNPAIGASRSPRSPRPAWPCSSGSIRTCTPPGGRHRRARAHVISESSCACAMRWCRPNHLNNYTRRELGMAEQQKIIAVVGATGAQGSGLVHAILADPNGGFRVRAITRHPDSDKGKALAAAGAEVVAADLDDEKSLERAFAGAYGAFCLTNFWEHFSPEKELAQATNMAKAAKAAGVAARHLVHARGHPAAGSRSSDNRMPTLQGKYKVPHFDAKGEADDDLPARRRADHVPAHGVLLGQLHPLRRGAAAHAGRQARAGVPDGRQEAARPSRRRTSARRRTPSSSAGRNSSAGRWASRAGI